MSGDLNGRTRLYLGSYDAFFFICFQVLLRFNAAVLMSKMFNCVMMRCLAKQQENEQLLVQKAFHRHASRVHNSCKKSPEGILLQCVCVCACAMGSERDCRGGGGVCENNIRLFRQNELYYCIQP